MSSSPSKDTQCNRHFSRPRFAGFRMYPLGALLDIRRVSNGYYCHDWFQEIQAACRSHSWRWGRVMSFSKLLSGDWIYLNPLGGNSEGSGWWPEAHSDEQRNSSFPVFLFWDWRPAVWSQGNPLDLRNWKRSFSASLKAPWSLKNFYSISWWVTTIFPSLPNLKSQVWISIVRVRCQWRKSNRLLLRLELGHLTPCCKSDVFIIIILYI